MIPVRFPASRADGQKRLANFVPHAGRDYAVRRNTDTGPEESANVSLLSPYIRHRLITEREILQAVLAQHSWSAAEKFVQEIMWRTYWKGWLEMRPGVWRRFLDDRNRALDAFANNDAIESAESGHTGIDGFDDWARELVATGYLHNHARMWFASIWIFTLRLPWSLGADFFLRHLIDADAASNTLSWRWVAGLQTVGKTYLATADNIARFTNGRFMPRGLATEASSLTEPPVEPPLPLPLSSKPDCYKRSLLLVTHDDLAPESLISDKLPIKSAVIISSPDQLWGDASRQFAADSTVDTASRVQTHFGCKTDIVGSFDAPMIIAAAEAAGVRNIIIPHAPVGPVADALCALRKPIAEAGIEMSFVRRGWDSRFWPYATKGFYPFKEKIAAGLVAEGILSRG